MDLGIAGRHALVCGSSQGLGFACAQALAREGCNVVINGRDADRLAAAADRIAAATGHRPSVACADMETEAGRDAMMAACPEADILVNNNQGPPPVSDVFALKESDWLAAFGQNMLPAVALMLALVPGMQRRRFGRVVNITSAMVKSPRPRLELSTAARTALTAVSKTLSIRVAADNVTINNLLPERIDTDRQRFMAERMMAEHGITMEQARERIAQTLPARRFGRPEEFADACAFLCSAQAGFISGQNLQLDGGAYPGLV